MNTLITTYYENPELFYLFLENNYNTQYFSNLIVIDDCSQKYPAQDVLKEISPINTELYRVTEDVGFNSHGARNLAAKLCQTEWMTFLDVDTLLTPSSFVKIHDFIELEEFCWLEIYFNQFLIPKRYYMVSGGYDERLNGYHWGDFLFLNRLHTLFTAESLDFEISVINKRPFHYVGEEREFLRGLQEDIEEDTSKNPLDWYKHKTLNFEWEKIWI